MQNTVRKNNKDKQGPHPSHPNPVSKALENANRVGTIWILSPKGKHRPWPTAEEVCSTKLLRKESQ